MPSETPEAWLEQWPVIAAQRRQLVEGLRSGRLVGSFRVALQTCALLRNVAGTCRWATASELLGRLIWVGRGVVLAEPLELASGNVLRRCLLIVREEYGRLLRERDAAPEDASLQPSLQDVLLKGAVAEASATYGTQPLAELRQNVLEQIVELYDEIENCREPIAAQAPRHVNENDVVLTIGDSRSVRALLRHAAAKNRTFEVFVAEGAPSSGGRRGADQLQASLPGCSVTLVPDAAVYALMARVHKVLLPCYAVLADGALATPTGGHVLAAAAKAHAVPVLVPTGLYKLAPKHIDAGDLCADRGPKALVLPPAEAPLHKTANLLDAATVVVSNPRCDKVPPELVDLFVTNTGPHHPSYVYRLLSELYAPEDHDLADAE
jgi:translation initiation factor eIF-2B subunit beta